MKVQKFSHRKAYQGFQNDVDIMPISTNQRNPFRTMDRGSLFLNLKTSLCIALFGDDPWIKSISFQIFISKSNNQF